MTAGVGNVGFLGAGRMAVALSRAWVTSGLVPASAVLASDPVAAARDAFGRETSCPVTPDNAAVVAHADTLVLAVKPQSMPALLAEVRDAVGRRKPLVVSIAAGVTLSQLASSLGPTTRLVRVMPNTPALVGAGASGFAAGECATDADVALVATLLDKTGVSARVPEHLLDAVTGLSGSGPAFVYQIIEALSDGGVRVGLPRDVATKLAAQTLLGASKMVLETGRHPGSLKDDVASPGGTTIAGLHELERGGLRAALMNAVQAATLRAAELGRNA